MKYEEWVVLESKEKIFIMLYLVDLVLFNVSKEKSIAPLLKNFGIYIRINP
jgi:hypothetical protein